MKESGFFMEKIAISSEFITLGQFLKFINVIPSGGMVKHMLETLTINVNDIPENRRGKKLYPGDKIFIKTIGEFRISSK
jgi:ribosome-associated protein